MSDFFEGIQKVAVSDIRSEDYSPFHGLLKDLIFGPDTKSVSQNVHKNKDDRSEVIRDHNVREWYQDGRSYRESEMKRRRGLFDGL